MTRVLFKVRGVVLNGPALLDWGTFRNRSGRSGGCIRQERIESGKQQRQESRPIEVRISKQEKGVALELNLIPRKRKETEYLEKNRKRRELT